MCYYLFMRKHFTVLIFLAIVNIWGCSTKNEHQITTLDKVFRKITLDDGKSMSLGQDITEIKDLCIKNDEGYSLKPGTFISADSFALYVNEENKIHTIHTYYDAETSFDKMEEVYKNYLNVKYDTLELSHHSAKAIYWHDDESVFALIEIYKDEQKKVFSALYDRKLCEEYLSGLTTAMLKKASDDLSISLNMMKLIK